MNVKQFFIFLILSTAFTATAMEEKKEDNDMIWTEITDSSPGIDRQEVLTLISSLANNLKDNAQLIMATLAQAPHAAPHAIIAIIETITPQILDSSVTILTQKAGNIAAMTLANSLLMNLRIQYISPLLQIIHQTVTNDYITLVNFFNKNQGTLVQKITPLLFIDDSKKLNLETVSQVVLEYKEYLIRDLKKHFKIKDKKDNENKENEEEEEED